MATNPASAAALLALVRDRSYQPRDGGPDDTTLLRFLNTELRTYAVPVLLAIGEEFFVVTVPFATVSGTKEYPVPVASVAGKIRDVLRQMNATDDDWFSLAHTEPERALWWRGKTGLPVAYYIRDESIVLLPTPTQAWNMEIKIYQRAREIVTTGYSLISGVSGTTTLTVTVASTTGMATGAFDSDAPSSFAIVGGAMPGTVASGTTVTFTAASLTAAQIASLAPGNYLVNSGAAPVADVPPEAADLLGIRTAAAVLLSQSDPRASAPLADCERMKKDITKLFAPRAAGKPRKVVGTSGPGWSWYGTGRWNGGW